MDQRLVRIPQHEEDEEYIADEIDALGQELLSSARMPEVVPVVLLAELGQGDCQSA